jgi:hypothetical protein
VACRPRDREVARVEIFDMLAAVYVMGVVLYVLTVLRGPIRIASMPKVAPR